MDNDNYFDFDDDLIESNDIYDKDGNLINEDSSLENTVVIDE